ncbi:MAG: peptidoglycan bridge formation protein FemAB [Candidatus Pacebacteria bacterium CG_4_10_14_0_8_um_filter_43_12]|nr:MAG: peptidoglycan bridge formation protein FemAB [Candidatus Pacebacteria bacterium CG10_big_fil_rev_8_21_14_0_10_44_11]PIY79204.1 MAG: peptidoglycan bridge formation protein FemAB [Candidatus Pacebacteria bacterium CG_4_10_14_0_8_um_filter_43_12]
MIVRALRDEERPFYNKVVQHPMQAWEWGEFRRKNGQEIERIGVFEGSKLVQAFQLTFHKIPQFNKTIGYFPKGPMPDEEQLDVLRQLGKKHNALFIKLEPNIAQPVGTPSAHDRITRFLLSNGCVPGRPLFTKYTFQLDLTKNTDTLFENLRSKTRYNINLADKKGVEIFENTTQDGMEQYIKILEETTKRQGFYAHSPEYFRLLWGTLGDTGLLRIFSGVYSNTIVVSWIMFVFNGILYYPYGASRAVHRDVMASNLMMWEMIQFGKSEGCTSFDMWGSLGPEPDKKDPWYGFHRFKEGYGGTLMEFVGTYDLVIEPLPYKLFRIAEDYRWKWLRLRARIGF